MNKSKKEDNMRKKNGESIISKNILPKLFDEVVKQKVKEEQIECNIKPIKKNISPQIIKQTELKEYLSNLGATPAQRSAEWYTLKSRTIGGSEIATLLGLNPFRTEQALIAEKIGLGGFDGNTATRWGTIMEHITKCWCEIVLQTNNIEEAGSIPGVIDRQRYSPDGLGIVRLKCYDDTYEWYIVLFEFKAPLGSLPNGKIPKYYMPQVQTGLLNIPLADVGIFVNNCYRICSFEQIGFSEDYNEEFHKGDFKKRKNGMKKNIPLACGVICFYQSKEEHDNILKYIGYISSSDDEEETIKKVDKEQTVKSTMDINSMDMIYDHLDEKKYEKTKIQEDYFIEDDVPLLYDSTELEYGYDFGTDNDKVERLFQLYDQKRVNVLYYPIILNYQAVNRMPFVVTHDLQNQNMNHEVKVKSLINLHLKKFKYVCEEKDVYPVGFLPWKLFASDILTIDRQVDWKEKIETKVKETLDIIDEILKSDDPVHAYHVKYSQPEESTDDMTGFLKK